MEFESARGLSWEGWGGDLFRGRGIGGWLGCDGGRRVGVREGDTCVE